MRFSLIVATLNRHKQLDICVQALLRQSYEDYEIIIIDQSDLPYLEIQEISDKIKYIHISEKGLSHARNVGLATASGEYICLVDDDGIYESDVLETANKLINEINPLILGGKLVDRQKNLSKPNCGSTVVTWKNAFKYHVSPSMIIKKELLEKYNFDERLGVGTEFGSGEETDIVFAALHSGGLVYFTDKYCVNHPIICDSTDSAARTLKYAYGRGGLLKKVYCNYSHRWALYFMGRAVLGNAGRVVFTWFKNKELANIYLQKTKMICKGFWDFGQKKSERGNT